MGMSSSNLAMQWGVVVMSSSDLEEQGVEMGMFCTTLAVQWGVMQ